MDSPTPSSPARRRSSARPSRAKSNGTYGAEVLLDGYGADVTLKVSVVAGDESIHVDYTRPIRNPNRGCVHQLPHKLPLCAFAFYALKCLLDPDTPNNEGCITPVTDEAPSGSILNPESWAAGNSRNVIGHVIPSLIFRALEGIARIK